MTLLASLPQWLAACPPPLAVALLAFVPEVESRGSVPLAMLAYHMGPVEAVGWTLVGNLLAIPVAWVVLSALARAWRRVPGGARSLEWVLHHTRRRAGPGIARWQAFGVFLFIAVPLPGTGAWAGVAAARLFGLPLRKAWFPAVAGTVVACVAVTLLVMGGKLALE